MIAPAVVNDNYYSMDYGFTITDFHQSYDQPISSVNHVPYGLKQYIQTRISTAQSQLQVTILPPQISKVSHDPLYPTPVDKVNVQVSITSQTTIQSVSLKYRTATTDFVNLLMYDDGYHNDNSAGDNIYGVQIPEQPVNTIVYYYIQCEDQIGNTNVAPVQAPFNSCFYRSEH